MKTIYMSEQHQSVRDVFAQYPIDRIYSKADLLAAPEDFRDTAYIFSTWGMTKLNEEEIRAYLPSLKAIFYGAGSVQAFARPYLACGVRIFSAWMANAVPVAEYTASQILLASKGYFHTCRITSPEDRAAKRKLSDEFPGNYDTTVGIIGAGTIGKLVIRRLKESKLNILVFDPFLPDQAAEDLGVQKVSLDELFRRCQVVSNHLANNAETKGMLTGAHFTQMPPYATFLNTGRGAQVVEPELINVLKARPDLMAILDVTDPEPPVEGSEFYSLPNCVLTPHIAGSKGNEFFRMADYMHQVYKDFLAGKPCPYEVTADMLQTMA